MLRCGCMVPSVALVQKIDAQKYHAHDNLNLPGVGGTHRSPPVQQELMASTHGQMEYMCETWDRDCLSPGEAFCNENFAVHLRLPLCASISHRKCVAKQSLHVL